MTFLFDIFNFIFVFIGYVTLVAFLSTLLWVVLGLVFPNAYLINGDNLPLFNTYLSFFIAILMIITVKLDVRFFWGLSIFSYLGFLGIFSYYFFVDDYQNNTGFVIVLGIFQLVISILLAIFIYPKIPA
ncbi:MAG: hypothetical protein HC836_48800 [Richelia sp. RM2_1_2]|nr:hypothetical protein [Richelia sp. RM1_1_1]NJO65702.1 hypothetical protein [Richelia sp. RM2_1_2]